MLLSAEEKSIAKARKKAYEAGAQCCRENTRLNDLHYFDLPNSIDKNLDLMCQEYALQGYLDQKNEMHKNQIDFLREK